MHTKSPLIAAMIAATALPAFAEGELNLYSSRHYDTDERLYSDFTEATGITINRIEGNADELLTREKFASEVPQTFTRKTSPPLWPRTLVKRRLLTGPKP